MKAVKSVIEYGAICCEDDYDAAERTESPRQIFLQRRSFDNLKHFIAENTDTENEVEKSFTLYRKRGREYIKVSNYVGVVETADGTTIEILPKIYELDNLAQTRACFLKMLRHLRDAPFIGIDQAHLKRSTFPILDVFISAFLDRLDALVKTGLKRAYISVEENQPFLKGKLLFAQQIRDNLFHPERFYVAYDQFDADIAENRLIKSTLLKLQGVSRSLKNQNRIRAFTFAFDEIPISTNIAYDFDRADTHKNRLHQIYDQLLEWAKVFLSNQSFTNFKGRHLNNAILFPMERIFEDYVAYGFRKYAMMDVSTQDKTHHLVQDHGGSSRFRLRPDLVLQKDDHTYVLDCKWKLLDQTRPRENYKISQSDMYQLFAYGKKYQSRTLVLIYPMQERFQKPLDVFIYDEELPLHVLPFNLNNDLESEVSQIIERGLHLPGC